MNFFIDTEFLEGKQPTIFNRNPKPVIDLISIGIISNDNRSYCAISKDFNIREAWNRYDLVESYPADKYEGRFKVRNYWIRNNILLPIFIELCEKSGKAHDYDTNKFKFTYRNFKRLIKEYGKSNKQIAHEVKGFIYSHYIEPCYNDLDEAIEQNNKINPIQFYGYYADYDWVVFCWLFGRMIDLPKCFPMYCIDLKQMLDAKVDDLYDEKGINRKLLLDGLKDRPDYPKQYNEHNALSDAKWNKRFYEFINKI